MNLHEHRVDGIPMRWAEHGDAGPSVVFLHGIPTSPRLWRYVLPRVPAARCLAWEMVGYGSSIPEGRGRHISVSRQADYLIAWLDALDVREALFVGHDLGGGVAQIAAARHPDRFRGLVLTNSIAYDSWPIPEVQAMRLAGPLVERLPDSVFGPMLRAFVRRGHDDRARASESAALHWGPYAEHDGAAAFVRQIRSLNVQDTLSVADLLPRLTIPVRIVWGAADAFQDIEYAQRLARDLRAPLDCVDAGRHFMPEDHPDAIVDAVVDLLRRPAVEADLGARPRAVPPRSARTATGEAAGEPGSDGGSPPIDPVTASPEERRRWRDERGEQERVPPRGTRRGETVPILEQRPGEHPPPRDPAVRREDPIPDPEDEPASSRMQRGGGR